MKAVIAAVPALYLSRTAQADSAWLWRLAGLSVAVVVPMAFWTLLLVVLGLVFDFAIGPIGLAIFAAAIGLCCLLGASAVMSANGGRT